MTITRDIRADWEAIGHWDKRDRQVYVKTAAAFMEELQLFCKNLTERSDYYPLLVQTSRLSQLEDSARMLQFHRLHYRIMKLGENSSSTPQFPRQKQLDLLEDISQAAGRLDTKLKKVAGEIKPEPRQQEFYLNGVRVLVAEDMKTTRIYIKKILEMKGAQVVVTRDGAECLDAFHKLGPFDIIIMDIFMPGMNGLEATKEIRKEGNKIPIIALTALASRDDKRDCQAAGCTDYLTKPVDANQLLTLCRQHTRNHRKDKIEEPKLLGKVLLITQNRPLAVFMEELLLKERAIVETADNSETGLHLFIKKKDEWDLLIIDEDLMGKNWREFGELVLSISSTMDMLLLVREEHLDSIQDAITAGFRRVIPRPARYKRTLSILKRYLTPHSDFKKETSTSKDLLFASCRHGASRIHHNLGCNFPCEKLAIFQRSFFQQGGDRVICRYFNSHGRCGLILADVAGHDNKSSLAASWLTGIVEGLWRYNQQPEQLLKELTQHARFSKAQDMESRFICLLVLLYDPLRNKLHYANAGIPPGYIVDMGNPNDSRLLEWSGTPIGLLPGVNNFQVGHLDFFPGNRIFLATDGIFESIPPEVTTRIYSNFTQEALPDTLEMISDYFIRSLPPEDDITIAVLAAEHVPIALGGLRLEIQSTYHAVDEVMKEIDSYLENNFSQKLDTFIISTAVREMILNAVEHGNKKKENKRVDLDMVPKEDRLEFIISDEGPGFHLNKAPEDEESKDPASIQGRGLMVLEQLAVDVSTRGGTIRFAFMYEQEEEEGK